MSQPFIGEIKIVPYNFAPRGWAFCSGQLLDIANNTALFSLFGTTYGGDGQTTFALPDLRGNWVVHAGQGPGLSNHGLGAKFGTETVALTGSAIPAHTHTITGVVGAGSGPIAVPTGAVWGSEAKGVPQNLPYSDAAADTTMSSAAIAATGGGTPHENRPPYLCLNYIVALVGIFPARN